jgi:DNA-binding LacI/PurR family transcriptional regulator
MADNPVMKRGRTTLKDVARVSGVSSATVSFVLNETPGQTIPDATRERVQRAARELDYAPHRVARALREGSSRVVVLNVDGLASGNSLDGFIRGMRDELAANGHALAVQLGCPDDAQAGEFLGVLAPRAVVDIVGLYLEGPDANDGGWVDGIAAHTRTQLRYLVDRGHSGIAFAVPAEAESERMVWLRTEYAGEACRALGLASPTVCGLSTDVGAAAAALADLRDRHPEVTAIAAFDDEVALRVLAAMSDLHLVAPEDLAVIGFDDGRYGALWRPPLTTVHIEAEAFGWRVARSVLRLEVGDWKIPPSHVIERATV